MFLMGYGTPSPEDGTFVYYRTCPTGRSDGRRRRAGPTSARRPGDRSADDTVGRGHAVLGATGGHTLAGKALATLSRGSSVSSSGRSSRDRQPSGTRSASGAPWRGTFLPRVVAWSADPTGPIERRLRHRRYPDDASASIPGAATVKASSPSSDQTSPRPATRRAERRQVPRDCGRAATASPPGPGRTRRNDAQQSHTTVPTSSIEPVLGVDPRQPRQPQPGLPAEAEPVGLERLVSFPVHPTPAGCTTDRAPDVESCRAGLIAGRDRGRLDRRLEPAASGRRAAHRQDRKVVCRPSRARTRAVTGDSPSSHPGWSPSGPTSRRTRWRRSPPWRRSRSRSARRA